MLPRKEELLKFFYAKHEHTCHSCKSIISRGEIFVRIQFNSRQRTSMSLLFHAECYSDWNVSVFNKKFLYWKEQQIPPKKIGRPLVPTSDRPKRRRLLSLLIYHRKAGNEERVLEIRKQIYEVEDD